MSRRVLARSVVACAFVGQAIIACSLLTDYTLPGQPSPTATEAGIADAVLEVADANAGVAHDAGGCTEKPCVVQIAAAGQSTCARTDDGAVFCWGFNRTGVVGGGTPTSFGAPTRVVFDGPVDEIAMGGWGKQDTTACARRGATVECWGEDGNNRKLGRGGDASAGTFVPVPAPVLGLSAAPGGIGVGSQLVCARVGDGLSCWGKAYDDTLLPTPTPFASPKPVTQVAGGRVHTCVLLDSEEVACAGYPYSFKPIWNNGNKGPGQPTFQIVPGVSGVTEIAAQSTHICVLKKGGAVLCWGRNSRGELGRGSLTTSESVPAPVSLPQPAKAVASGANHSCAVLADETVWCWGRNGTGKNWDGTTLPLGQCGAVVDGGLDAETPTPRKIDGLPAGVVRSVVGAYEHSCALMQSGAVYCWGSNRLGQLGRGSTDELPHPTADRVVF
jgi:hypothetical protein